LRSGEFLGESDEKSFRPADVAKPIRALILDYFADELRAALAHSFKRLVDIVYGEHDAEIAESVHWGVAVIRNRGRCKETGKLEPAVAVRRTHHGDLDPLIGQSSDTSGPLSFNRGSPFELEAEFAKEINRRSEVINDDSNVVHSFERHVPNLTGCA